jgi:hypothetical protein
VVDDEAIVVTGIGAITAVGGDAIQTASAVRAGVPRFALWPQYPLYVDGEPALTASEVPGALGDAPWLSKTAVLRDRPVIEALWRAGWWTSRLERSRVGTFLAAPSPRDPGDT